MKKNIIYTLGYLLLIVGFTVSAQNIAPDALSRLPNYYPSQFQQTGILQAVNLEKGILVINATQYHYDINVKVHSLNTAHSSLSALKSGMGVGYNMSARHDSSLITEIWVLPANAVILR